MMKFIRYRCLLMMALVMMMTCGGLLSQTITNPEEEYSRIRTLALSGDYTQAEPAARNLVKQFPGYGDARILLGRIIMTRQLPSSILFFRANQIIQMPWRH